MRILIADSDQEFRDTAQAFLVRRGHDTKAVAEGIECANILRDFIPEIAVLDCGLLWGGYQGTLALMRDNPRLSGVATILIADEMPQDAWNRAVNPMHLGWLRKPFRLNALLKLIDTGRSLRRLAQHTHATPNLATRSDRT